MAASNTNAIALLDVDHTLLFPKDELSVFYDKLPKPKQELIKNTKKNLVIQIFSTISDSILKEKLITMIDELHFDLLLNLNSDKVNDIYLFTDMTFRKADVKERLHLIQLLAMMKFKVHGVITPSDPMWHILTKQPIDTIKLYDAIFNDFKGNKFDCKELDEFVSNVISTNGTKQLFAPLVNYSNDEYHKTTPRIAFRDISVKDDTVSQDVIDSAFKISNVAKVLLQRFTTKEGYAHPKAIMLALFLTHNKELSHLHVFDDNEDVIKAMEQIKDQNNDVPMTINHVSLERDVKQEETESCDGQKKKKGSRFFFLRNKSKPTFSIKTEEVSLSSNHH